MRLFVLNIKPKRDLFYSLPAIAFEWTRGRWGNVTGAEKFLTSFSHVHRQRLKKPASSSKECVRGIGNQTRLEVENVV